MAAVPSGSLQLELGMDGTEDGSNWGPMELGMWKWGRMLITAILPSSAERAPEAPALPVCANGANVETHEIRDTVLAVNAQAGQGWVPGLRLPEVLPTCRSPPLPHPH